MKRRHLRNHAPWLPKSLAPSDVSGHIAANDVSGTENIHDDPHAGRHRRAREDAARRAHPARQHARAAAAGGRRPCRPDRDPLPVRHDAGRSGARRALRRAAAARDPDREPARRRGHRPGRHRDHPDAQRAGDFLRAVGRGDRRGRQPGELLPQRLADRRHHEGGRRQGADRRRSLAVPRHLAEGRGDPRRAAGAQGVPRRRQGSPRLPASSTSKPRSPRSRATGSSRPRRSSATRSRRCSTPAARPACRSSRATPTAR